MSVRTASETGVALPSLAELEPLPSRYEEELRTVPAWLRGEDPEVIRLIQIIEDIDINGPEEVRDQVSAMVPRMVPREVEMLISYINVWTERAGHIESGYVESTYGAGWEQEAENLRTHAISDAKHAIDTFGVQA